MSATLNGMCPLAPSSGAYTSRTSSALLSNPIGTRHSRSSRSNFTDGASSQSPVRVSAASSASRAGTSQTSIA